MNPSEQIVGRRAAKVSAGLEVNMRNLDAGPGLEGTHLPTAGSRDLPVQSLGSARIELEQLLKTLDRWKIS